MIDNRWLVVVALVAFAESRWAFYIQTTLTDLLGSSGNALGQMGILVEIVLLVCLLPLRDNDDRASKVALIVGPAAWFLTSIAMVLTFATKCHL